MDKKSFLIYLDYEEQFDLLTDEQIGQLMRAIIKYEKTGEEPVLDGMIKMAFSFIKKQLDRDREKWTEEKQKRSEAGRKGGISRAVKQGQALSSKSKQCLSEVSNAKQSQANQADKVEVKDKVDVKVEDIIKKENKKEKKTEIDKLIDENFSDQELKNTLYEFIKMRKAIKKPLTTKGLELLIKKLYGLSLNVDEQIEILNNSIMNNWQGIFELKNKTKKGKGNFDDFKELWEEARLKDEQARDDPGNSFASW